jgi:hypothetical protein
MEDRQDLESLLLDGLPQLEREHVLKAIHRTTAASCNACGRADPTKLPVSNRMRRPPPTDPRMCSWRCRSTGLGQKECAPSIHDLLRGTHPTMPTAITYTDDLTLPMPTLLQQPTIGKVARSIDQHARPRAARCLDQRTEKQART